MYDLRYIMSIFDLMDHPDFENLCNSLDLQIESSWLEKEYDGNPFGQGDAYDA